jgi:RIO kinase 1
MCAFAVDESTERFMSRNSDIADMQAIQEFIDEGLVREVLNVIKSGKEATVYRCRAHPSLGAKYTAVKVYHESGFRNFGNDAVYQEGRVILNGQVRRAVRARTEFGREAQLALWVDHEFEALSRLFEAGADVPEPFACTERAVLLEYVGDGQSAASQLQHLELEPGEAGDLLGRLLWNIELWLAHDTVHADLSAFNVLFWQGRAKVIDFPQWLDPRFAPAARRLLERDIRNVGRYFARYGLDVDAAGVAADLWRRFEYGELG